MLFQASITIPANTTESSPTTEIVKIAHGIITEFKVRPRPGHAALAHLVIRYHEHQIAPSTEGMDLHGDTFPIDWTEHQEIKTPPYDLKLVGWNDDDTYPHTFDVYVVVLPRVAILALAVADVIRNFLGLIAPRQVFRRSK